MRRERLVGDIVPLSASALDSWHRCRREYRSSQLLRLPPSDESGSPDFGNAVHALLRLVHETGSCRDDRHVDETLVAHGFEGDGAVLASVTRHARRCPGPAEQAAHEVELARFHRLPVPMFLAVGRIDAIWIHDGILDARDYKTGHMVHDDVARDPRARIQAWLLAAHALRRGLRLQVRYEYLAAGSDDDPQPFEPGDDDLEEIEEELRSVAEAIHLETDFEGVRDAQVCRWCRYRSLCPDSAMPAVPSWQVAPSE